VDAVVTTDWLAERLGDETVRVVDVRWYLDPARKGIDAFRAGHIPRAVFLDLDRDLSAPVVGPERGRHPWPSEEQVARVMGRAGISGATRVIAYDDQAGAVAARLWYVLRAHGHDEVALLDGGIAKWVAEKRPLETAEAAPATVSFTAKLRPGFIAAKDEVRSRPPRLLLDARAAPRFRGETEPIDSRAGHIPGARNAPYASNLTGGDVPVFLTPEALRRRYAALGAGEGEGEEPVVYCGSGVTACHDLVAMHLGGLRGRLYPGSWSEWSADASLPVETGGDAPSS
jgi:thiosulfate/3-mercaptopyruvate sulfurtransferase